MQVNNERYFDFRVFDWLLFFRSMKHLIANPLVFPLISLLSPVGAPWTRTSHFNGIVLCRNERKYSHRSKLQLGSSLKERQKNTHNPAKINLGYPRSGEGLEQLFPLRIFVRTPPLSLKSQVIVLRKRNALKLCTRRSNAIWKAFWWTLLRFLKGSLYSSSY